MKRSRSEESGFVLLFILLMSAAVAIMLYRQLPRVAFESVRGKEQLAIHHGEQYKRAIQLYVNKNRRYPQSLDDLDKGTGQKFLRRRFKDPFTKKEWRLLKVDAAGVITNSKIKKKEEQKPQQTFITEFASLGDTGVPGQGGQNIALRRRPSEGGPPAEGGAPPLALPSTAPPQDPIPNPFTQPGQQGQPGQPNQPGQPQPIDPATGQPYPPGQQMAGAGPDGQPNPPGEQPPMPGINPATGQPYQPGEQPNPGVNPATGQPFPPGINPATGQPFGPGQQMPVNPATGQPNARVPNQQGGAVGGGAFPWPPGQQQRPGQQNGPGNQPFISGGQFIGGTGQPPAPVQGSPQQGQQQFPQQQQGPGAVNVPGAAGQQPFAPGGSPGGGNAAIDAIRKALMSPSQNIPMNMGPAVQLGPGIAGVASDREGESIRVYREQQEYDKWEFVYDPREDPKVKAQLNTMTNQQQQMGPGGLNQQQMGPGGLNQQQGPGRQPGFNQPPGGFNQPPGGFNQPPGGNTGQQGGGFISVGSGQQQAPQPPQRAPGGAQQQPGVPTNRPGFPQPQQPGFPQPAPGFPQPGRR